MNKRWIVALMLILILTGCGGSDSKNDEILEPLLDVVYTADNGLQICFRSDGMIWKYNPDGAMNKEVTEEYKVLSINKGVIQIQGAAFTRNGVQEFPIYEISVDNDYEEIRYLLNDNLIYYRESSSSGTLFADQVYDENGKLVFARLQEYIDQNGYEVVQVESGKGGYYDNIARQDTSERSWGKYGTYKDFSYTYAGDFEHYSYSGYGFENNNDLTTKVVSGSGYSFRGYTLEGITSLPQAGTCYFSYPFFIQIKGEKSIVYKLPSSEGIAMSGVIDFSKTEPKVYMDDPKNKYDQAVNLYDQDYYSEAYVLFKELESYEDSNRYASEIEEKMQTVYAESEKYMQPGNDYDPAKAFESYSSIIVYEDSEDKAMEAFYQVCLDGYGIEEKYVNALTSMMQHFEKIPVENFGDCVIGDSWLLLESKRKSITKDFVFLENGQTEPIERKKYNTPLVYNWNAVNDKLFFSTMKEHNEIFQHDYDIYQINDDVIVLYLEEEELIRVVLIRQNSKWSERILNVGRSLD